ncbi:hypothetical protein BOTBODRAFT_140781 [Botryobasidium botryosum FD-172 SS1]|uniref:Uncharacterized protein n=1 Tax=Botryobasidium botryosum (strain FD-172 SS1) TaxID=930990 RepID=A0A067LUG1_BOTB1|nr:hypothetical protein BOTBODRAFT_140781 [Botryobasidium botryosum FD-172 SS1]
MFSIAVVLNVLVVGAWALEARQSPNATADQTSLTLAASQVQSALASTGIGPNITSDPGTVASLTSTNNFINWCETQNAPITNGKQQAGCNPTIMGMMIAFNKLPSAKFQYPKNLDTLPASQPFTIQVAINNLQTGNFVNAQTNFFAAPSQVNSDGIQIGHSHIVIESVESLTSTSATDPTKFILFQALNNPANGNNILSVNVTHGLSPGVYRAGTVNTASNHQPILASVAQHGLINDVIYFTVTQNGKPNGAGRSLVHPSVSSSLALVTSILALSAAQLLL